MRRLVETLREFPGPYATVCTLVRDLNGSGTPTDVRIPLPRTAAASPELIAAISERVSAAKVEFL
jgi:hypothetical protein